MKNPSFRVFVSRLTLVVLCVSLSRAEAAESAVTLTTSAGTPALTSPPVRTLIDLDFPGGSVAQLVTTLSTAAHTTYNLIGEKEFQEITLPPITLHSFDPIALTAVVNTLLRGQNVIMNPATQNIFVVTKAPAFTSGFPQLPTFQAFQIGPYLTNLSIDDIIDAVKTAWVAEPAHGAKAVSFKFHPETKLLFVYGPPEAIAVANVVIPQLNPVVSTRLRNESFAPSTSRLPSEGGPPSLLHPSPEDEASRLHRISEEVRRRRELRDAAASEGQVLPLEKK